MVEPPGSYIVIAPHEGSLGATGAEGGNAAITGLTRSKCDWGKKRSDIGVIFCDCLTVEYPYL
jgi:hypothetical protein